MVMTSPRFTRGPWAVSKRKARRVTNVHGVVICNAVLRNKGGPKAKAELKDEHEAEANADLIAAAPKMYAALERAAERFREYEMLHFAKGTPEGLEKAARNLEMARDCEDALSAARGETTPSDQTV
jgi:hypothetical protein